MIDKTEYIKWYNLAKETINNEELIPKRIDKEIIGLVSREDWLLFAPKGLSKEEVVNSENPNIFFDITSRKKNSNMARLGLTFNNLKSYEKFKTIMRGYNKEIKDKVTQKLLKLDNSWKIEISSKIKDYNYAQPPEYTPKMEWNTNQINDNIVDELVKIGENIREEGQEIREKRKSEKRFYVETPSINLMESTFLLNKEEFCSRVLEIFGVLSLCVRVKTNIEINKVTHEKTRELKDKKSQLEIAEKHKVELEILGKIYPYKVSEEQKKKNKEEIERLKSEIGKLEKELKNS